MTRPVNGYIESRVVHVRWYRDSDQLNNDCAAEAPQKAGTYRIFGCAKIVRGQCYVKALLPHDFNDEANLAFLGHEALHCFGARHGG